MAETQNGGTDTRKFASKASLRMNRTGNDLGVDLYNSCPRSQNSDHTVNATRYECKSDENTSLKIQCDHILHRVSIVNSLSDILSDWNTNEFMRSWVR